MLDHGEVGLDIEQSIALQCQETKAASGAAEFECGDNDRGASDGGDTGAGAVGWATNSFTNNIAYQTTADTFDSAGNITQRIWRNASGTTNRIQTLSWDARGRLHAVTERDATNSGYNWTANYDALSRRISTTSVLVSNNIAFTSIPTTINSYFDPQVEFLELGVSYGVTTEWKLYGPDLKGIYGGMNGASGLEGVSPYLNLFYPVIGDFRGNILGVITNGILSWNPARPTGYGAVPGYRPVPLANGASIALSSAWRGRWVDLTGYYQLGLRPYDPVSGRWLTYDSVWNERDPNCYSFAGGDPINGFDSDGRISSLFYGGGSYNPATVSLAFTLLGASFNQAADNSDSSLIGGSEAFLGNIFTGAGIRNNPYTYINGVESFGHNIGSYYQDYGFWPAAGYATSSWNVGLIYSGAANFNLQYDTAGLPIGDWWDRSTMISSGVGSTATVAAGGLGIWNWATAPATATPPILGVQQYSEPIGPPSLATSDSQAFFWSGIGRDGASSAAQIAAGNGGVTLEMTLDAQGVQMPAWDAANPQSVSAWQSASQAFAQGASGDVTVILGNSRPGSVWNTVEMPALQANENVTSIIRIDPQSGETTVLWQR